MSRTSNDKKFIKTQEFRFHKVKEMIKAYNVEQNPYMKAQIKHKAKRTIETLRKLLPDAKRRLRRMESAEVNVEDFKGILSKNIRELKI